jgi:hypothetical protein
MKFLMKIIIFIIFFIQIIYTSGPRRDPPVFNNYHTSDISPGQTLYKMIPVNVLLTYDVDCSPVNGITPIPCQIYLIKNANYFFDWFAGVRNSDGWYMPPTTLNVTTQTIQIRWPVPSFNKTDIIYFAIHNPENSVGTIRLTYNCKIFINVRSI